MKAKQCALCKKSETSPKDKNPILMVAYSSDNDKWLCSGCYKDIKHIDDIGAKGASIIEILSADEISEDSDA